MRTSAYECLRVPTSGVRVPPSTNEPLGRSSPQSASEYERAPTTRLPERFFVSAHDDLPRADLLLVMGTSLQVQPFAGLVTRAPLRAPRLLVNRERVGQVHTLGLGGFIFDEGACASVSVPGGGLVVRDGYVAGDTDAAVWELAERLAWREELQAAVDAGRAKHARGRAGQSSASGVELDGTL